MTKDNPTPSPDTSAILAVLRATHWEQAKGHLQAMMATYYTGDLREDGEFMSMDARVQRFIAEVEDNL